MKHLKIYENFKLKEYGPGTILKRKTFDDKGYQLFLIKNIIKHPYSEHDTLIYKIGDTNIFFDKIHFLYNKEGIYFMNKWFAKEYEYLTDEEYKILLDGISKCDRYILKKIKMDTNIDISLYPLKYDTNKYNL